MDSYRPLRWLLTGLTLVIVAISVNRLTGVTLAYLPPHEFLRWQDFNAMVPITLAALILYWLVFRDIERRGQGTANGWLSLWRNRRRFRQLPFTTYIASAYTIGIAGAVLYKLVA